MPQDEKRGGPIVFTAAGQVHPFSCRIIGVLWEGATTAGDRVEIRGREDNLNSLLWACRTDTTNSFLGAIWGVPGVHAPDGFRAAVLASGNVLVYLSE